MKQFTEDRAIWLARNVLPHEPALRAWLSQWRIPGLEMDDVVQDTYAVLAGRESVTDIRNPRTYCFQTARSIILMHLRRSRVVSIRAVEDIDRVGGAADAPSPEQQVSDREELHQLAAAIAGLSEPGRSALTLRMIDGLSQREIGQRLGLSENAAQKQIAKSIHVLMKVLGRGGYAQARASNTTHEETPQHDGQAGQKRRD